MRHEDSNSLAETKTAGDICHTRVFVLKIHQELLLICTYSLIYFFIYLDGFRDCLESRKRKRDANGRQEAEPLTGERRRELEHYLKLKRYKQLVV